MTLPVALLHGFTGTPDGFRAVLGALAATPPSVFAPALIGHGPTDADRGVAGFEDEVDRIAALLGDRAPRWHLAGYSLGGRVALGLLARHAALFESATLIGAQPGLRTEAERASRRAADDRWCHILEERGIAAFVDEWESLPLFATQAGLARDVLLAQREERLRHDPRGLARSLRSTGLGVMPSYWADLGRLRVSTRLMVGALDAKFSDIAEAMSRSLPAAIVESVPRAGHNVVLERPDAVARALSLALEGDS